MTELGSALKSAREANGLNLDDLQRLTKIQKRYLIGIEKGNYDMMPGKFYVRAFIKQYAEAVGLEPEEVFEQYKNDIPSVREDELPEQLSRVQSKKTMSPAQSKLLESLPKILVAVFLLGLAIAFYFLITNFMPQGNESNGEKESEIVKIEDSAGGSPETDDTEDSNEDSASGDKEGSKDAEEKEDEEKDTAQKISVSDQSSGNTVYELTNADEFKLKLTSTGQTWVQIETESGTVLFSGMLNENESEEHDITEEEAVKLNIGNAVDTEVYVNGEQLEYAIDPAEKVTQKITINYVK